MSLLRSNLLPRLRLLRTALTRRYIYDDLGAMARANGLIYADVRGNAGPFDLAGPILGAPPGPDFAARLQPVETFTPPGAPAIFNSEPSVSRFLGQLVFHKNPAHVVELGSFVGWTSAHLALALQARGGTGRLICVDYMTEYLELVRGNLRRHGLDALFTPVRGMSLDAAVLAALPPLLDIVFLDTSHDYPETLHEILAYAPRLAPGGCLVLHDSVGLPGVRRSLEELPDRFFRHTFATERGNGVTVLMNRAS